MRPRAPQVDPSREPVLVGTSEPMRVLRDRLARLAPARSSVLLEGETGTGKGLAARILHRGSPNREEPFVHVDCGTLAAGTIESALFGHERGAFTGAVKQRAGFFERAGRGTVFLDEVGELPPSLQAKLLRVLHDHEFERVGGSRTLRMEARVVAATARDLDGAVESGGFRRDLYFRLAVVRVCVPPLRTRLEDVPALVRVGLRRLAGELGVPAPVPSAAFLAELGRRTWPGNVRELWNLLEHLLVERPAVFGATAVETRAVVSGAEGRAGTGPPPAPRPPRTELARLLEETGGNVARAARRLGLARSTLRYRITREGLGHLLPRD